MDNINNINSVDIDIIGIDDSPLEDKIDKKETLDFNKLSDAEVLEIIEVEDELIVPITIAAKLKGVTVYSIYNAINKGILRRVNGVYMSDLERYKVDMARRENGIISVVKKGEKDNK